MRFGIIRVMAVWRGVRRLLCILLCCLMVMLTLTLTGTHTGMEGMETGMDVVDMDTGWISCIRQ